MGRRSVTRSNDAARLLTGNGLQTQCGVNFFSLDSRRVLGPRTHGAGIRHQNTSQIQILLASHFEKKKGAMLECEIDGPTNSSAKTLLTAQGRPGQYIYGARDTRSIYVPPHNTQGARPTSGCETDRPTTLKMTMSSYGARPPVVCCLTRACSQKMKHKLDGVLTSVGPGGLRRVFFLFWLG